jgi:hypothetical protein
MRHFDGVSRALLILLGLAPVAGCAAAAPALIAVGEAVAEAAATAAVNAAIKEAGTAIEPAAATPAAH